jgi:hypothetical protein
VARAVRVYRGYQAFAAPAVIDKPSGVTGPAAAAAAAEAVPAPAGPKLVVRAARRTPAAAAAAQRPPPTHAPRVAVAAASQAGYGRDILLGLCLLGSVLLPLAAQQNGLWQQIGLW